MVYTVTLDGKKQTYEGFRRLSHSKAKAAEVVAMVWSDGDVETWMLDATKVELAVSELQRFYRSEFSGLNADIVVYRNPTLYLSDTAD